MKILGIVAGRHGGNSEILVKEALAAAQEKGAECKLINLFDYHIEHCTGCEACTMQMGEVAMDPTKKYKGCILKDKDDMDRIVNEMQTCNGVIIGVPTYDLTPSSLYLKFAQRFLAYELSFRLEIGDVAEDPHTVGGLIAVGGSCHDWQTLALEGMGATMFTQSIVVVDQMMATRNGRPGNVLLRPEQLARAHKMGERRSRRPWSSATGWATRIRACVRTAIPGWCSGARSTGTASSIPSSARSAAPAATWYGTKTARSNSCWRRTA